MLRKEEFWNALAMCETTAYRLDLIAARDAEWQTRVDAEQRAHEEIARICFNAEAPTGDGTSVSAVRNLAARVDKLAAALKNLVYTASKLWDDTKPIKDSEFVRVTHPIIEEARAALGREA